MNNKPQKWTPVKGPSSIANAEEAMRSGPSGPNIMHRGMSEAEYNNVRKSGKIESRGAGNVGRGERGLTFFSGDPRVAASYAHLQGSPSYVVSARRPSEGGINIDRDNGFELGVNGPTDAKNIAAVYRGDRQGRDPWSWQRVAASGGSINPEKAIRAANMIARRVTRDSGGETTQDDLNAAIYGDPSDRGTPEWAPSMTSGYTPDNANAVTGPHWNTSGVDPMQQLYNNRALRDLEAQYGSGNDIKRGGRVGRAPGGSLSDAINSFSKEREDSLKRPASGSAASDAALLDMLRPHPQLAIAEPEDSRRRMAPSGQVADLGAQIDEGAHWLAGQSGDEPPVVSGVHQTAVKQGRGPTLLTTKSFSNAPDANGAYRPAYSLSNVDLSPDVINTIAGEARTNDPAGTDAVINNMFNRLGSKGYGPSGNLLEVARAPGQYTGYRRASPEEAQYIQSRIQAIASGQVPDNTNGSMEYRGAWLYDKAANMHPDGVGVGGNWFFKTPIQPGPYAARQSDTESAQNSVPAPTRQVDAQGIAKVPNRDGSFTLTDQNGQTIGYDRGSAPLASVPQSQPHMQPAQVPAQSAQPAPTPPPQQQPQQQPPSDQLGQADPMSNMFDRMAMMPEVASGYDSPQVLYQPDQARRGGYVKRAAGGPAYASMPTNELIARALEIIRKHRDAGGSTTSPPKMTPNQVLQAAANQVGQQRGSPGTVSPAQIQQASAQEVGYEPVYGSIGRVSGQIIGDTPIQQPWNGPSAAAPAAPQAPVANNPAVAAGTVGNAAGATGSPIGTIPMAAPTQPPPPDWNNTLDQALQTNNPTMNQIFGFNYPQNLPSPKPQPQGPVSQDEINALYGFGGGSQMGTGTFQSGGAIIMDALNRARRATGGKIRSPLASGGSAVKYPLAPRSEWYGDANYDKTGGKMINMSPKEYLSRARPMDPNEETARDNINDLKNHIKSGRTLDPLALYPNGKEDGRHRAYAAHELGIKSVPVLTWDKG